MKLFFISLADEWLNIVHIAYTVQSVQCNAVSAPQSGTNWIISRALNLDLSAVSLKRCNALHFDWKNEKKETFCIYFSLLRPIWNLNTTYFISIAQKNRFVSVSLATGSYYFIPHAIGIVCGHLRRSLPLRTVSFCIDETNECGGVTQYEFVMSVYVWLWLTTNHWSNDHM